ncbi:MAG: hypothetical protein KKA19_01335 [Candidatus Margulisbacteria bacterium]|nr:hypothetical protein [Candidatus Margulisiibacteriota bacterium]
MPQQIMPYLWMVVAGALGLVLIILALVLWEVRKTVKAFANIAERISILTDIRGWFDFFHKFKKKKKD